MQGDAATLQLIHNLNMQLLLAAASKNPHLNSSLSSGANASSQSSSSSSNLDPSEAIFLPAVPGKAPPPFTSALLSWTVTASSARQIPLPSFCILFAFRWQVTMNRVRPGNEEKKPVTLNGPCRSTLV